MPRRVLLAVSTLFLSAIFCFAQQVTPPDFTFILFPDTQNEAQYFPQVMASQTKWVANNRTNLNIQAVLGLGDIVNDGASTAQQQNADAAIKVLDNAGIPYLLSIGNHDYDGANTGVMERNSVSYAGVAFEALSEPGQPSTYGVTVRNNITAHCLKGVVLGTWYSNVDGSSVSRLRSRTSASHTAPAEGDTEMPYGGPTFSVPSFCQTPFT